MKKPELLVTPTSVKDIELLAEAGADAIMVGEQHFGLRLAGEFKKEDLQAAIELAHKNNMKAYVAVNAIFHNEKIEELKDYIKFISNLKPDAIVFGDPAVIMTVKEVAPEIKMHWSTETLATNYYTCNYWGRKGAKRSVLARELNMDAIVEIKENAEVEIEIQVHGMTSMFQSKRSLIGNYYEFQGKSMKIENGSHQDQMFLHDKERDNKYPIFEDENGTHIMSPNDICIIDELEELIDAGIDSFKIEGLLKSSDYIIEVTKKYRQAIDLCVEDRDQYEDIKNQLVADIEEIQPTNRPLDTGFFYKETVY
jgi:putative protease